MDRKPLVAFFGIDGCGKTTLIKEISKRFVKKGEKTSIVYMGLGEEFNLPFLKTAMKISSFFRGRRGKEDKNSWREHNYRKRSFLWVLTQYSEFWIRYHRAKKLAKEKVVPFDRFFYDGLILGGPFAYKFFRLITPVPDKSFLIYAAPEIIIRRKNEAGAGNIKEYYEKAQILMKDFPIIKINNAKSIKSVVNEIYNHIYPPYKNSPDKKIFDFLNENNVKYAFLRGNDEESIKKGKDLDILILRKDYDRIKAKIPKTKRVLHFYPNEEKHFGFVVVPKSALGRRVFDKEKQTFVLSKKDFKRMDFFRGIIHFVRSIKRILGVYNND